MAKGVATGVRVLGIYHKWFCIRPESSWVHFAFPFTMMSNMSQLEMDRVVDQPKTYNESNMDDQEMNTTVSQLKKHPP